MARINFPDLTQLSDSTLELIAGRPIINVLRMFAHSEPLLPVVAQQGATQFGLLSLTPRHRELIILAAAAALEAPYIWDQHVSISEHCGINDEQRKAIRTEAQWANANAPFAEPDKAVLKFAFAALEGSTVADTDFAMLSRHLSERQIVEAVTVLGYYFTIARMTTILEIEIDAPGDQTVLDAGLKFVGVRS